VDVLTGLANRRGWEDELLDCTTSSNDRSPLGIVALDVDGLKALNDAHGHAAGDQLLQTVAAATSASIRRDDFAARIGGDEIAILLRGGDEAACRGVVTRIREALHASPAIEGHRPAASLGWAIAAVPGELGQAVQAADSMMYREKRCRA
jgi:diguanylate cyclase (GGDEF)-like protein